MKSASQGNKQAQFDLAEMYYDGKGVEKDIYAAIYWYRLSYYNNGSGVVSNQLIDNLIEQVNFEEMTTWGNVWTVKSKSGKTVKDFNVNPKYVIKYPEIMVLSLLSESMLDDEREEWFDRFEEMSTNQMNKFYEILYTERTNIDAIEEKYNK